MKKNYVNVSQRVTSPAILLGVEFCSRHIQVPVVPIPVLMAFPFHLLVQYPIIQGEKNWKFLPPVAPVILLPSTFWGHSLLAHAARQHVISVSYSTKPVHNKTTTGIQLSNIMPIKTNTTNIEDWFTIEVLLVFDIQ